MRAIALLLALSALTPGAVAARCRGEASFAIPLCACTVRNRLDAGWTEGRVLEAYYAPSVPASKEQIESVAAILRGEVECNPKLYFMYGAGDVRALGLGRYEPTLTVRQGSKAVYFYSRDFRRKK